MTDSMLDFVVAALHDADVDEVARDNHMSRWTVQKIRLRQIKNPGVLSVEPLFRYFKKRNGRVRGKARKVA